MVEMIALLRYIAVACVGLLAVLLVIRFVRSALAKNGAAKQTVLCGD
ncbi:MAG: hypothetical protein LUF91_08360 [Oscillospiraceae bacterium]|nr:hypothetical protein [Oscillospiraceae bacterium]